MVGPKNLHKLGSMSQHIKNKILVHMPEQNISVDESLMLWKGQVAWKQYIPLQKARYGIKSFKLYTSSSGYIW